MRPALANAWASARRSVAAGSGAGSAAGAGLARARVRTVDLLRGNVTDMPDRAMAGLHAWIRSRAGLARMRHDGRMSDGTRSFRLLGGDRREGDAGRQRQSD